MWYFVGINVGTFVGIYEVNHVSTQAEIEYWMRYFVGRYVGNFEGIYEVNHGK